METLVQTQEKSSFLRISQDWIDIVHERKSSVEWAYDAIITMKTTPIQPDSVDLFLQKIVDSNVAPNKKDKKSNKQGVQFPGPMAVQMSRRDINNLLGNTYWITEKSDGIRCMMLVRYEKEFPCWVWKRNGYPDIRSNIFDNCAIEYAYIHCTREQVAEIHLNLSDESEYLFGRDPLRLVHEESKTEYSLVRTSGRSFSYVFDRKYQFYLVVDEYLFPTRASLSEIARGNNIPVEFQRVVVFDGEIVWNMVDKRYNYSVYDLVTFMKHQGLNSCLDMRMKERIDWIGAIVSDFYQYYKKLAKLDLPKSLQILPKHFYPMDQMTTVLSCIKYDPESGHYLYKKYNRNDGLVFTPDDPKLYRFGPGKCSFLLKWKWVDHLSIDFQVRKSSESEEYELFYPSLKGQQQYFRKTVIEFGKVEPIHQGIVELIYDRDRGIYKALGVRTDKTQGNSYPVITTTLENMIEDITLEEITHLETQRVNVDSDLVEEMFMSDTYVTFKIEFSNYKSKWFLNYYFSGDKGPVWQNYHSIDACIGPNGETDGELINLLVLMSRQGELYARCVFLGNLGFYNIVDFNGKYEHAHANQILLGIEKMAQYSRLNPRKRKFNE